MADEHLHATVSVRGIVIEPRGRILVLQRAADSEWELPGGRLAPGEPTIDGLHREITEETGLPADIDDIVAANSWINTDEQGRFAVHYRCYAPHREIPLSDEHVDAQWITQADVDALLREPQVAAVRAAIDPSAPQSSPSSAHDRSTMCAVARFIE